MKEWNTIYQNNHLSLMKIHIGLAIFYGLMAFFILYNEKHSEIKWVNLFIFIIILITPSLIHIALAFGARQKSELSRRLSMVAFILIFLLFPIGSIFSVCVGFPALQWEENESE